MHISKERILNVLKILIELVLYSIIIIPLLSFGGVELRTIAIIQYLIFVLLALSVIKSGISGRFLVFKWKFKALPLIFLFTMALSTVMSENLNDSYKSLIIFFDAVLIFFISLSEKRTRQSIERFVFVLILTGLILSMYAIFKPLFVPYAIKGSWHITGTFYNHNHFASFISLLIFFPVFILFKKKNILPWKKYFLLFAFSINSIALIVSLSRGALVSVLAAFMLFGLLELKKNKKMISVVTLFFCPSLYGSR